MDREQIKRALIGKIKEKYQLTTEKEPTIDENTAPFKDLEYFDSLLASEVGVELQDVLECDFDKIKEAFKEGELEGITINQMANIILEIEDE